MAVRKSFSRFVAPGVLLVLVACSKASERGADPRATPEVTPTAHAATSVVTPAVTPLLLPPSPSAVGPRFATGTDIPTLTWTQASAAGSTVTILLSQQLKHGWTAPRVMAQGPRILANWADVPAAHELPSGKWILAYPERRREGGRDYGMVVARFDRAFQPLGEWTPDDVTRGPETGFVDVVGDADGATLFWLDGRQMEPHDQSTGTAPPERSGHSMSSKHSGHGAGVMTLRALHVDGEGHPEGASTMVDERTCECCKLDGAMGPLGPWVAYRDRDAAERRDIRVTSIRLAPTSREAEVPALTITTSLEVHRDGWTMPGCPVNGPALSRSGDRMFSAWFTAANGEPRVWLAQSPAHAPSFSTPRRVDLGDPVGRVDLLALDGGELVVTWIEGDPARPGRGRLLGRLVSRSGELGPPLHLHDIGIGRDWGFPRASERAGDVTWIWTHADGPHSSLKGVSLSAEDLRASSSGHALSPQSNSVG